MRLCNKVFPAILLTGTALSTAGQGQPKTLVHVSVTVTDHQDRLAQGLTQENFQIFEDETEQRIGSFDRADDPVSIGIILDLSGSMRSKLVAARESILRFLKTSNPADEFFVIGFNNRPALIEDFTSSVSDIQLRLATVHTEGRTALWDAIHDGVEKMKEAKYQRKALLVITDGGNNRLGYREEDTPKEMRESDVEVYTIDIFDPYAATFEGRMDPQRLNDLSEKTGGRMYRVEDLSEMGDIAEKISTELRNQYVIGYNPKDLNRDGKWRKVKVKLNPPSGLPPLTVHARTGYYAPLQ
jgi:Ca-activated chloride channel family protein